MGMKPSSNNPTFSNVTPRQVLKLQEFALDLTGKRSASALLRLIADNGNVVEMSTTIKTIKALIVEQPE